MFAKYLFTYNLNDEQIQIIINTAALKAYKYQVIVAFGYKSWLEHTARRTAKRTDADFTEIWKGCVEKDLGAAGLKKEHREWIRDFGAFLGQGDRETMGRSIELSMKQMDLMIRQQRGELAGKRKIGNWLGVMSGLFLIILLW